MAPQAAYERDHGERQGLLFQSMDCQLVQGPPVKCLQQGRGDADRRDSPFLLAETMEPRLESVNMEMRIKFSTKQASSHCRMQVVQNIIAIDSLTWQFHPAPQPRRE
uniref:Uncharacterized protein n=1 Tax=Coccidioides posadasii RMSCC 3488 TaxID=454284 RepID=A0A0J6FBC8_COCPO|nr:hypothetical protein CPAG_02893 [Coccidioides posadasii RMSCC 3488]